MVHVPSTLSMAQLTHYSLSHVPTGSTTITLKIISSTVLPSARFRRYFIYLSFVLVWTDDPATLTFIAYSLVARFQVRLPAGDLQLIVDIRDTTDCVTVYNLSSVIVQANSIETLNLIDNSTNSSSSPLTQLLATRNQNTVGQVISSVSQQLNTMNNQTIDQVISSKFSIEISP